MRPASQNAEWGLWMLRAGRDPGNHWVQPWTWYKWVNKPLQEVCLAQCHRSSLTTTGRAFGRWGKRQINLWDQGTANQPKGPLPPTGESGLWRTHSAWGEQATEGKKILGWKEDRAQGTSALEAGPLHVSWSREWPFLPSLLDLGLCPCRPRWSQGCLRTCPPASYSPVCFIRIPRLCVLSCCSLQALGAPQLSVGQTPSPPASTSHSRALLTSPGPRKPSAASLVERI